MLDFSDKVYKNIFDFCVSHHREIHYFEYPFFFFDHQRLSFSEILPRLANNFTSSDFPLGLYIHVPFCRSRCFYCRFYSEIPASPAIIDDYLEALRGQLAMFEIDFRQKTDLRNVYIGGGTPTLLNEAQLDKLFRIIRGFFRVRPGIQLTIEANPETLNKRKVDFLKKFGVSRISIGVQSFNDKILRGAGRRAMTKDVRNSVKLIRNAGMGLAVDLIVGLPGENRTTYQNTIREVSKLEPDFIEEFVLVPVAKPNISRIAPGYSLEAAMKQFVEGLSVKYRLYSRANSWYWVRKRISVKKAFNHNIFWTIWEGRSFLGLGPSAISFLPNIKFASNSNLEGYINYFKFRRPSKNFFFQTVPLNKDDMRRHFIVTCIASGRGFPKMTYFNRFYSLFENDFPRELGYLKKLGIIVETKDKFIWRLDEREMGQKSFFMHALKFWYHPRHIRRFAKLLKIIS